MTDITLAHAARTKAALDKLIRVDGKVMSYRQLIADATAADKSTFDGTIDYNRRKFNNMDHKEQRAYEARLKAKIYYAVKGVIVPKLVYDAV